MHSPRTDPTQPDRSAGARFLRGLDARLVLALSSVALIGLLVSGLAINQILPRYFAEQAERRLQREAVSTELWLQVFMNPAFLTRNQIVVPELRNQRMQEIAQLAASTFAQATVEIYQEIDDVRVAHAVPGDIASLDEHGLRPDPQVAPVERRVEIDITVTQAATRGDTTMLPLVIRLSEPFTSREASLQQINDALFAGGLMALFVAFVVGALAARRLVVPLRKVQRASERLAAGQLDERVPVSGVVEIDELGAQFNTMADRLRETLTMLEADRDRLREFVADVSHELRTPIAALRTFTDLQQEGELDPETRREFLERSSEQIRRLEWLSNNLLDLSRIDAGILPLDVQEGDLREPVRSVVEAHAEVAESRQVSLTSEVPAEPVPLAFDRERMIQLVTNLVGNALKFTSAGGAVTIAIVDEVDEVVLEVRDTGPGIEPGELPHIFDRFYRGTNVGEARASGSGLGLAIARSIAEMHAGRVEVESIVGEGATFRLRLPRSLPSPDAEAEEAVVGDGRRLTERLARRVRAGGRQGPAAADAGWKDQ